MVSDLAAQSSALVALIGALVAGLVPAFLWLMFWLREDRLFPEPRRMLTVAFFTGMLAVLFVLFPQKLVLDFNFVDHWEKFWLAFSEEFVKFILAVFFVLPSKYVDEPIDAMIYMVTVALGFAALENTLYVFNRIADTEPTYGLLIGNLRYLGATLVHVVSSALVGAGMSFMFYKRAWLKFFGALVGVLIATIAHGAFNYFLFKFQQDLWTVFGSVWVGAIIILIVFERVKTVKNPNPFTHPDFMHGNNTPSA